MGSAVLASKGLLQSPPQISAPAPLRDPSGTRHSSSRVPLHILATELEARPPMTASLRPHRLQGTGRGQASTEKLAAYILELQKTRAFAHCVSLSTEIINMLLLPQGKPVPQPPGSRMLYLAWGGNVAPSETLCLKDSVRSVSLKLRIRDFMKQKGLKSN